MKNATNEKTLFKTLEVPAQFFVWGSVYLKFYLEMILLLPVKYFL